MTLQEAVAYVKAASSQYEAVRRAYEILTARYHGKRVKTFLVFWRLFEKDVSRLWQRTGFLHCIKMNVLLRYLLISSGWFKESDVVFCWTQVWYIAPHQFAKIRLTNGQVVTVDVWAAAYGVPFGSYAHGFH